MSYDVPKTATVKENVKEHIKLERFPLRLRPALLNELRIISTTHGGQRTGASINNIIIMALDKAMRDPKFIEEINLKYQTNYEYVIVKRQCSKEC